MPVRAAEPFPHARRVSTGKVPRREVPDEVAVVDQVGCTGCEVCVAVCPVDCVEILPGPEHPGLHALVEVELERCIGCRLCAVDCPWETIEMWPYEAGIAAAPGRTLRSLLYDYPAAVMHPASEARLVG